MSEIQNITLSANREISKAIADERIFYAVVMRVVPSKDGQPQHIPVSVPLAVQGTQSIPGMIPLEEMDAETDRPNPTRLVSMRIPFVIVCADDEAGVLICSRKRAQLLVKTQMLGDFAKGEAFEGVVTGFTDFGAFVDVNGVSGLLRNADYSTDHSRVNERYKIGDKINVKCKSVSKDERARITWEAVTKYHRTTPYECDLEPSAIVLGRIIDIKNFPQSMAVFVRLEDNQELDVLCSMPVDLEIEKGVQVVVRISSVEPGATPFDRPRIRGRILRLG